MIAFAALMPHPPVLVPAVGRERLADIQPSLDAMRTLARELLAVQPETLVVISPHSPRHPLAFGAWTCAELRGSFAPFGAADAGVALPNDRAFIRALHHGAQRTNITLLEIGHGILDHGALVPLWFLAEAGWRGPTVVLALNQPGAGGLHALGRAITLAADSLGRKTAIVASGDMSHRLIPGAPAGYEPDAKDFDARFIELLHAGAFRDIERINPALQARAAEDVVDSCAVAMAATGWHNAGHRVLSYEGPFGVGYGIAVLYDAAQDRSGEIRDGTALPRLARQAVEAALAGENATPPAPEGDYLRQRGGVFVTIRTAGGRLRGCMGSLEEPATANLVEETWRNAQLAALRDPRFNPVVDIELHNLRFDVSVLHTFEDIASSAELDPARYGVLITTPDGRRATLLPAIEGIETAAQQYRTVCEKGGITPAEPARLVRYQVDKFAEPAAGGR